MRWSDRIGRRIKLSDLHVLIAVAQSGSMAKAAKQLAVSHPVVSRSVSDLEHILGVRLLERSRQGIELTASGRALLNRSNAAFDELRQGVKDIELLSDATAGEVRIATTPPLAASFVSAVIDRMVKRYPRMMFRVMVGEGGEAAENLIERHVDLLVFRKNRALADDALSFQLLFESPYVIAAGTGSPWLSRRRIEPAELMRELWALPARDADFGATVVDAFRAVGLDFPRTTVTTTALEMRANLLRTGRYLTVVPDFWLRFPSPHPFIKKLAVRLAIPGAPIGIFTLRHREPNAAVQRFIDCAHEMAKPLATAKA